MAYSVCLTGRRLGYNFKSQFACHDDGWTFHSGHTFLTIFLLIWQMSKCSHYICSNVSHSVRFAGRILGYNFQVSLCTTMLGEVFTLAAHFSSFFSIWQTSKCIHYLCVLFGSFYIQNIWLQWWKSICVQRCWVNFLLWPHISHDFIHNLKIEYMPSLPLKQGGLFGPFCWPMMCTPILHGLYSLATHISQFFS